MSTAMLAATLGAGYAHGATPTNTLPREAWAARVSNQDTPPSSSFMLWGYYPSAGEAFLAANAYAVSHGPLRDQARRMFSTGLTEAVPGMTVEFDPDPDRDGEIDTHLYTEPLAEFGASPRNCSVGDGALFKTGFSISPHAGLVYEPAEGPLRKPGPLSTSLCSRVYCQDVSGCNGQGDVDAFVRRAVATFRVTYEPGQGQCDKDRKVVFEDLLGRPSGAQSCEVVGGLNDGANLGGDCPALANGSNPVNTVTGNKFQREVDYAGTAHGELAFVRYYNSLLTDHRDVGLGWRHAYSANLTVTTARNGDQSARLTRADGRVLIFNRPASKTVFSGDPLTVGRFRPLPGTNVYEYTDGEDVRERFELGTSRSSSRGVVTHLLLTTRFDPRSGRRETLVYDQRRLLSAVQGRFGRSLRFEHDAAGRLRAMTDPAGRRYSYGYDRLGRLTSVTYPDLDDRADDGASRANNPQRAYRYDDADWPKGLTAIVDESGADYARWDYDKRGRALVSEHAGGAQRVSFDYQSAYTAITDALGHTRSYNTQVESGVGLISAVTGGDCNFCGAGPLASTTYDDNGHRNLVTDHAGNVTDYDYDANGLELRRREGSGAEQRVTSTTWMPDLRQPRTVSVADGTGRLVARISNEYWGAMLKRQTEEDLVAGGAARTTIYEYFGEDDPADPRSGLLKSVDGPRTDVLDVTRYDYDRTTGNLLSVSDALGHVTRYTAHDAEGRALTEVDANGVETRYQYDARGRLLSRSVHGATTRMEYDRRGLLTVVRFPDDSVQRYGYDAAQRLVRVANSSGTTIEYSLDALGNRIEERTLDGAGVTVSRQTRVYNAQNQLEQFVDGMGQTTAYRYDANGRLESVIDPRGGVAAGRQYDSLGRGSVYTDGLGGTTQIRYDLRDQPLQLTDPRGLVTRYERDSFGDLLRTESPDAGVSREEYDTAGNRIRHTYQQKAGTDIAVTYQYDELNRLLKVDYPQDPDVHYTYDEGPTSRFGFGRLTTMEDASGVTRFHYDERGNVLRRELASARGAYTVAYAYDLADRLVSVQYPGGMILTMSRDAAGRVMRMSATVGATTIPIVDDIVHHALGGLARLRFGNGLVETRDYDAAGRLASISVSDPGLPSYRIPLYDAADNPLRIEGAVVDKGVLRSDVRTFEFDALNRLSAESSSYLATNRRYVHDANGNRVDYQITNAAGAVLRRDRFSVEATSNRIHGANASADDYDAAGDMTRYVIAMNKDPLSMAMAITNYRIAYNEAGRLKRTSFGTGPSIMESTYNGFGERVVRAEVIGGPRATVYMHSESGQLLSAIEISRVGAVTYREYIWVDSRPLAEIVYSPGSAAARVNFIHVNQVDQPTYMTGKSGGVTWTFVPGDAFGMGAVVTKDPDRDGVEENPAIGGVFPGQVMDVPFVNNGFRDYDPLSGRYIETDPIGLHGGINTYRYAHNNPLRYVDPYGLAGGPGGGNHAGRRGGSCGSGAAEPLIPDNPFGFPFLGCCQKHDECYGTCNRPKPTCDDDFKSCLRKACRNTNSNLTYEICINIAYDYGSAVERFGRLAYEQAQRAACSSCNKDSK